MKNCQICNKRLQGNQQKYCSNKCKQKGHWDKVKEQPNSYHSQTLRALKRKLEFVNIKGGKCSKCNYNKNLSALEFHYRDSSLKEFGLDFRKLSNTKIEVLTLELDKCDLLCSNCHKELHNPEMKRTNVLKILAS